MNFTMEDTFVKMAPMIMFGGDEGRAEKLKEASDKYLVPWMDKLAARLADRKYLCGDSITIYDMTAAGIITNLLTNPSAKDAEFWKTVWATAPDAVKKYNDDFTAEMKDYLDQRVKTSTM